MNSTGSTSQGPKDKENLAEFEKKWDSSFKLNPNQEEKPKGPRWFKKYMKDLCWKKAQTIPERSPDRWRLDALGNPVFHSMRNCDGPLCYDHDHIIPFSKGGKTDVENCQVLQMQAYLYRLNKPDATLSELKAVSSNHVLTQFEMDIIEFAAFGSVSRPTKDEHAGTSGAQEVQHKTNDSSHRRRHKSRSPDHKSGENPQESSPPA